MVKINNDQIEQIRRVAENYYSQGDYYCSEAVVKAVVEGFGCEIPHEIVAMASGFPVGIGGAGCTCGAISGGVMAIGYFFGRSEAKSDRVLKSMSLSKELYDGFISKNRNSCCKILTRNMQKGSEEHLCQCVQLTGEVTEAVAKIINKNL